ncbi:mechanosensitive ion channel family protein [Pseudotabrizicola formosa]|uniref:mechanosensitive ion channel family protein n=1 Tax=Pseudotabrizicola formosa TaxID=2030009 RepID=UPI00143DA945|nr:mechanosensitive ion channel domain-containing protein [Pseudotabrizicola formosa]
MRLLAACLALLLPPCQAMAFELTDIPQAIRRGGNRLLQALPDQSVWTGWADLMAQVMWVWLAALAVLVLGRAVMLGRRKTQAIAARAALSGAGRWTALGRYALAVLGPVLLAGLVLILWAVLAAPSSGRIRIMVVLTFPVLAGAFAAALANCGFTLLAAHGRQTDRDITRQLPPQAGLIAGLIGFAAVVRSIGLSPDPFLSDFIATLAETIAALIAWRATSQQRLTLRHLLRGESQTPDADPPTLPERLTAAIADHWHILSYLFITLNLLARYGVFGADRRFGMFGDLTGSLALLTAAGVGVLLAEWLHGRILARLQVRADSGLRERLALRLGRVLRTGLQIAISLWAGAALLTLWEPELILRLTSTALFGAVTTTLMALYSLWFIWTLVDAVLDWSAAQSVGRGTRMRTLLPFLRNFAFVVVATLAGISVLSNLGVNVAPLLAGAGVVGIAIGIGAQKLVSDVITGIFIIFEDSIAIGEVIEAADKTGVVEGLTIRTLRLRDGDGALFSIPFSSITTLKNASRGYGTYTITVTLLNPEDTNRAMAEVARIGREVSEDASWAPLVITPFSLWGVDQVSPGGVVIKGNIQSRPNAQWAIGREINRRIALRFAELGIAQVHPVMHWGGPGPGKLPE